MSEDTEIQLVDGTAKSLGDGMFLLNQEDQTDGGMQNIVITTADIEQLLAAR